MNLQDDELVRRYHEASAQEGARPGAHVREAVRAHAQMVAAAHTAGPAPTPEAPAANQARWKISALATVAVVGLTGLLMLQFERGTPEERDTAFSHRRAEAPAPAAQTAPAPAPSAAPAPKPLPEALSPPPSATLPAPPDSAQEQERAGNTTSPATGAVAPKSTTAPSPAHAPPPAQPLAKTAPAPTPAPTPAPATAVAPAPASASTAAAETETLHAPRAAGAMSGFPASPSPVAAPNAESREHAATAPTKQPPPPAAPEPPAAAAAAAPAARSPLADSVARDSNGAATASMQKRLGASLPGNVWDAARAGNPQQIESLVRQGTPVDARDNEGRTALMLAAMNGHTTTAQKLLALGANPRLVDREGLNAAQWAAQRGHTRLAELLEAVR